MRLSKALVANTLWAAITLGLLLLILARFGVFRAMQIENSRIEPASDASPRSIRPKSSGKFSEFRSDGVRPSFGNGGDSPTAREVPTAEDLSKAREATITAAKETRAIAEEQLRLAFYGPHLAGLGLTPEQTAAVLTRLGALYNTAVTSGDGLLDLQIRRLSHDDAMRSLLGEEGYKKYRQVEELKPFHSEVQRVILPFAIEKGVPVDEPTQQMLVGLLAKHNVTLWESWDGPYDPLPRPGVGAEATKVYVERMLANLQGLDLFLADSQTSLPKSVFATVMDYFTQEKAKLLRQKSVLEMTPEQRLVLERATEEERLRQLEADLR